jgi:hypothetical protein
VRNFHWLERRRATIVLDGDLHERLMAAALHTSRTMQALVVKGAKMVLARFEKRHLRKVGWTSCARRASQGGDRACEQNG